MSEECRRAFEEAVDLIKQQCFPPSRERGFCDLLNDMIAEQDKLVDKYSEAIEKAYEFPDREAREEVKKVLDDIGFTEEGHRRSLMMIKEKYCRVVEGGR